MVRQAGAQLLQGCLFRLAALVGAARQAAVDIAAGERLEQLPAFVFLRFEEGGKFVLGQQHGARELFKCETDALHDFDQHFGLGCAQG